jgi:outer membrane protein assembly factor BamB
VYSISPPLAAGYDASGPKPHPSADEILSDAYSELPMNIDQLIFVGLNGYAVALDRDTGEIVWSNNEMKSGYVTLLLDGDRLIVSTNGYIYCLDPLTGKIVWNNPMRGYGVGTPTSLLSTRGQSGQTIIQQAAEATAAAARSSTAYTGS